VAWIIIMLFLSGAEGILNTSVEKKLNQELRLAMSLLEIERENSMMG